MASNKKEIPSKRKQGETKDEDGRTSGDESEREQEEPKQKASKTEKKPSSALKWLLSSEAFDLANPEIPTGHGEIDWDSDSRKKPEPDSSVGKRDNDEKDSPVLRYPQSHLTPFQNLVAASLLSKPISHKLGMRTIQTLLNPPFGLRTLEDLDEAGFEGRRKVMWEARTQHKEKTASQLGDVVDGIRELCGENASSDELDELKGVRDMAREAKSPGEAADLVTDRLTKIKGIGPGVATIFLRRVQEDWSEIFPFADERSLSSAREFDLVDEDGGANELAEQVSNDRNRYVRLLDVLVGLNLEKKVDEAKKKISSATR